MHIAVGHEEEPSSHVWFKKTKPTAKWLTVDEEADYRLHKYVEVILVWVQRKDKNGQKNIISSNLS